MSSIAANQQKSAHIKLPLLLQGAVMLLIVLIVPHVPRADVILLGALIISALLYLAFSRTSWAGLFEMGNDRFLLVTFAGLSVYLFANALWSQDVSVALTKAVIVAIFFCGFIAVSRSFWSLPDQTVAKISLVLICGALLSLGLSSLEFANGHAWREALYTYWPVIRPGDNDIAVTVQKNGTLAYLPESMFKQHHDNVRILINSSATNRNAALIVLLLWPLLLISTNLANRYFKIVSIVLIIGFSALAIMLSISQTAQVALVASAVIFLMARVWPRITRHFILAAWCIAVALAVPLSAAPYKMGLHKSDWIFESAQERITTWHFTSTQIAKAPIFGTGIRSTRTISKKLRSQKKLEEKKTAPGDWREQPRLRRHAHNQYLQIWYELGAVGAALILLLGLAVLQIIDRQNERIRPSAYATFVTVCVIAAFGWGLWQTWLMAGYVLAAMLMVFARKFAITRGEAMKASGP